jgi:hypothetical protein
MAGKISPVYLQQIPGHLSALAATARYLHHPAFNPDEA